MSVFAEFSLPVTAFLSRKILRDGTDVTVEFERLVPTGSVTYYLWIVGTDYEHVVENLRADSSIGSLETLDAFTDRALLRLQWNHQVTPVFDIIEENGAMLVDATGTRDGWAVTLRFPDQDALAAFYEECRRRGITLELLGINESGFGRDDDGYGLSPAQRETVAAAFEAGYFDVPRRTTIAELAAQLGVSDQAVSERLRRGLAKFLSATLREEQATESTDSESSA